MDVRIPDPDSGAASLLLRRALLGLLLGALAVLCLLVLRPFLAPTLWAAILAYVTWPLYCRLRVPFGRFGSAAASVMTLLVIAVAILPLLWLLVLLQHELVDTYRSVTAYLSEGPHRLPAAIRDIPSFGAWLQEHLDRYTSDPAALGREISSSLQLWSGQLAALLGGAGRNGAKLIVALLTLFFFYRDGDSIVRQIGRVGSRFFDDRLNRYVHAGGAMTRAVVYGLLITALAQGVIAGVGYWIFGLEAPAVLGVLTGLLSTAPLLGTALVWAPLGMGLVLTGHTWKGILLLAWGLLLVHPADNVLRPLFISSVTRVPFLLVMFGALGGLAEFGLVGVFVGPILLGIASAVWQEWVAEED
jgi:predicted PurR-regulated permease PerM